MSAILLTYSRSGGRPPADDELLELRADGSFRARRTVAGARIGSFAGSLPEDVMEAVRGEATACGRGDGPWLETPRDGATETIAIGDEGEVVASMGSNATPGGPWGVLVDHLRALVDSATECPVAALELVADPGRASLVAVGSEPFAVDVSTIECSLVRIDASGVPVDRWGTTAGDAATGQPRWVQAGAGWPLALPLDQGLDPGPGEWLQVRVMVTLRTDAARRGRLFVALSGG